MRIPHNSFWRFCKACKWISGVILTISLLPTIPAIAIEVVNFSPSNRFTFNLSSGNVNQMLGTVYIESDSTTGWTLEVRSLNSAVMTQSGVGPTIPYVLHINGNTINNLDSGNNEMVYTTNTETCASGCSWTVKADIAASDLQSMASGNYNDTLIFILTNH